MLLVKLKKNDLTNGLKFTAFKLLSGWGTATAAWGTLALLNIVVHAGFTVCIEVVGVILTKESELVAATGGVGFCGPHCRINSWEFGIIRRKEGKLFCRENIKLS